MAATVDTAVDAVVTLAVGISALDERRNPTATATAKPALAAARPGAGPAIADLHA